MLDAPSVFRSSASTTSAPPLPRRANELKGKVVDKKRPICESESTLLGISASVPRHFPSSDSLKISLICATPHISPFFVHGEPISRKEHSRRRASRVREATECSMRPCRRATATSQCQQTSLFAGCIALPFALSALLVGEVLLRDVERAVLSLNIAAREVLADHAKHGELKAAEQQN